MSESAESVVEMQSPVEIMSVVEAAAADRRPVLLYDQDAPEA